MSFFSSSKKGSRYELLFSWGERLGRLKGILFFCIIAIPISFFAHFLGFYVFRVDLEKKRVIDRNLEPSLSLLSRQKFVNSTNYNERYVDDLLAAVYSNFESFESSNLKKLERYTRAESFFINDYKPRLSMPVLSSSVRGKMSLRSFSDYFDVNSSFSIIDFIKDRGDLMNGFIERVREINIVADVLRSDIDIDLEPQESDGSERSLFWIERSELLVAIDLRNKRILNYMFYSEHDTSYKLRLGNFLINSCQITVISKKEGFVDGIIFVKLTIDD